MCNEGFKAHLGSCLDIDECAISKEFGENGGCQQTCINTEGSFMCACDLGYKQVFGKIIVLFEPFKLFELFEIF